MKKLFLTSNFRKLRDMQWFDIYFILVIVLYVVWRMFVFQKRFS